MRIILSIVAATLAAQPAFAQAADPAAGQRTFLQCRACHTLKAGEKHLNGPNLHRMFGSKAASKPGYAYSPALAKAGFTWTDAKLDEWLANPRSFLPGNKMMFAGVKDPAARRNLIAYLKLATK